MLKPVCVHTSYVSLNAIFKYNQKLLPSATASDYICTFAHFLIFSLAHYASSALGP